MKKVNPAVIAKLMSFIFFILSFAFALCLPVAWIYKEPLAPFLLSIMVTFIPASVVRFIFLRNVTRDELQNRDAFLSVVLGWFMIILLGTLPYLFSNSIPNFVNAFFESVSGFTTTGSSILTDIEILPKSVLFWRSLTHWVGGIGIISLVIIILPSLDVGGYRIFTLESSLQEKIHPRAISVGRSLLKIYLLLTFSQVFLMLLGGMNLFESLCHSFGTVATGGFSPKNTSIAGYSPYIQYVVTLFMFLAGVNFMIHYSLLHGKFRKALENEELKFYIKVVLIAGFATMFILVFQARLPLEESFRQGFFNVVSIISCTGFASTDYMQWPVLGWLFMFLLLFAGGSTGSTAGGIKMARHLLVLKNIKATIYKTVHRNAVYPIRLNGKNVDDDNNRAILSFVLLYLIVFLVMTLLLIGDGLDIPSAASSIATGMAGVGPGIGTVGPVANFAHLHDFSKIVMSFAMIIGRLEILTFFAVFTTAFWKY
jgi:trk system potassium uptake protein TrkH